MLSAAPVSGLPSVGASFSSRRTSGAPFTRASGTAWRLCPLRFLMAAYRAGRYLAGSTGFP